MYYDITYTQVPTIDKSLGLQGDTTNEVHYTIHTVLTTNNPTLPAQGHHLGDQH